VTQPNPLLRRRTTARAIQLGKKSEQFMADADFENYWDDSEFLAGIYQRE